MDQSQYYLILACVFGFLMAWGVGANDVANAMGTSVGSRSLTMKQAIIIAIIFEFMGAFFAGGEVTDTLRSGIIDASSITLPDTLILGMLASLLSGATWLILASTLGWPVSTTHTIVGAIVGFGAYAVGIEHVYWSQVTRIAISWLLSPILGLVFAFSLFWTVQRFILNSVNPLQRAQQLIPFYMFLVGWTISSIILFSGLAYLGIELSVWEKFGYTLSSSLVITVLGGILVKRVNLNAENDLLFHYTNVEKLFGVLMLFTACAMAFAHGSNDVANAIGPVAAIASIVKTGSVVQNSEVPKWILMLGASGIVLGLVMYGHKVIATIGSGITELTPTRGFSATLSAAGTVVLASSTGLPVSTTHTLVGAILGVGLARGINALNTSMINKIFLSWLVTLPAGAILTIVYYHMLSFIFSHVI